MDAESFMGGEDNSTTNPKKGRAGNHNIKL